MNHDLRKLLRHAFAGTQIERYARPAPVADIGTQRDEGFRTAFSVRVLFVQIAWHRNARNVAGGVLAPHHPLMKGFGSDRCQRLEHLHLLIADAVGGQIARRVHGDQAEQLQQMVLDHVTQLAGLVEIAPASFDADRFGHGDFYMGDMMLVPLRLEQAIGEAQRYEVLYRFLAQIVIDAIDATLGKVLGDRIVDDARRRQIMADGLFQNDPRLLGEPCRSQEPADVTVDRRGRREIGDQGLLGRHAVR